MTNFLHVSRYSKPAVLALMLIFSVLNVSAQGVKKAKVTGNIITTDKKPAIAIAVYLKNTTYGCYSDGNGNFSFEAPEGEYILRVHSISAHHDEFQVTLKAGQANHFPDITVRESSVILEKVVVTGQFSPQSMMNSIYRVKVIDSETIEQKGATDMQSLLNTEIGVRLSNDMALGETDFEIMGMSGNNVKVLIDGVPVIDRGSTKQSLSQIDISTIDRVEIVEGPMSVVYGTDALAGVINIITKKPEAGAGKSTLTVNAGVHEETAGDEYELFSGEGLHRENINIGWASKMGIYLNGGFARNTSGGWTGDKTGREKQWQPKDQYMYNGTVGYRRKDMDAWYSLSYLDEQISTAINASPGSPDEISDRDFNTDRLTHQLHANWRVNNKLSLNLASSYQDYQRKTKTVFTNILTGEKSLSLDASAQDKSVMELLFARATASWNISSKISLQPGIEYQWDKGSGERIEGEPSISDLSMFLSAEWRPLEWLHVRPGVRTIVNSDYDAPFAIPALLTRFFLNDQMDIRASYAYGFRSPKLRELYFSFHNANHNIDGNPDLKAEHSNNFSLAFTWRILHSEPVRLTTTVTGFYNSFRDRIAIAQDVNDPLHNTYQNVDKFKTTGGTLENNLTWKDLYANLSFSMIGRYNQYSNISGDDFLFSPEVSAGVGYKFKTDTSVNLFYKFTGKREAYAYDSSTLGYSLRRMREYNWLDFTVSQKVWDYLTVNAGVKNILDITTVDSNLGSGSAHGASGASFQGCGRSFFLGLSFNLTK